MATVYARVTCILSHMLPLRAGVISSGSTPCRIWISYTTTGDFFLPFSDIAWAYEAVYSPVCVSHLLNHSVIVRVVNGVVYNDPIGFSWWMPQQGDSGGSYICKCHILWGVRWLWMANTKDTENNITQKHRKETFSAMKNTFFSRTCIGGAEADVYHYSSVSQSSPAGDWGIVAAPGVYANNHWCLCDILPQICRFIPDKENHSCRSFKPLIFPEMDGGEHLTHQTRTT